MLTFISAAILFVLLLATLLRMMYLIFLRVSFTDLLRLPMDLSWVYKVKDLGALHPRPLTKMVKYPASKRGFDLRITL
jgi:hypothetical protein